MTPAPSSASQLSSVRCGQSRMEASVPKHCTLSIAKVAGTEPKRECIVCTPVEYPSILWNTFYIAVDKRTCQKLLSGFLEQYQTSPLKRNKKGTF